MRRIALFLSGTHRCQDTIRYSKTAEDCNYHSVWVAEDLGLRDSVAPLAALSMATSRVQLATGIMPAFYRTPALTAMTLATLDELSNGRIMLGLGTGDVRWVAQQGITVTTPVTAMREYIHILKKLLSGERVSFEGKINSLDGVKLDFERMRKIPIFIGARKPKLIQLAGELAEGVLNNEGFCAPEYVRWVLENIAEGAERSGRNPAEIELASYVIVSVNEDHDQAKLKVKRKILSILAMGLYDEHLERMGLSVRDVENSLKLFRRGSLQEACEEIPDTLVEATCIFGTAAECGRKMRAFRDSGVSLPVVFPVYPDVASIVELAKEW